MLTGCSNSIPYDLMISHANILDVQTGLILENKNILIRNGKITGIQTRKNISAKKTIDAQGKLVTPGLIDTHIHPTDVFGDYTDAPLFIPDDSISAYRIRLTKEYLPYGVTTALMMGHPENWLEPILQWNDKQPQHTDFLTCGGALISKEERKPYIGHLTLHNEKAAAEKIIEYYQKGIRHIKLYYRLREPEFSSVIHTADSLDMKVFGHIGDFDPSRLNIHQTLNKNLLHYEHIATFPYSLIKNEEEWNIFNHQFESLYGKADTKEKILMMFLEAFRYVNENKKEDADLLIARLAEKKASFSTTIGYIYQHLQSSHYFSSVQSSLSEDLLKRSKQNFSTMMFYLKKMADSGIKLRIATDTEQGGKVFLTELKILADYGFSIADIFKIATINAAECLAIEKETGVIAPDQTANLIIWDSSPFDNAENFFSSRTIIKNGVQYVPQ